MGSVLTLFMRWQEGHLTPKVVIWYKLVGGRNQGELVHLQNGHLSDSDNLFFFLIFHYFILESGLINYSLYAFVSDVTNNCDKQLSFTWSRACLWFYLTEILQSHVRLIPRKRCWYKDIMTRRSMERRVAGWPHWIRMGWSHIVCCITFGDRQMIKCLLSYSPVLLPEYRTSHIFYACLV